MAMYQAKDTFAVTLKDGSSLLVTKGAAFHESHEVVRLDDGRGVLFAPMEETPEPAPAKKAAASKGGG